MSALTPIQRLGTGLKKLFWIGRMSSVSVGSLRHH